MAVEFVGGSLHGQQRKVERWFEYFNHGGEVYYARAIEFPSLGWVYVWYQFGGSIGYHEVMN